jgi:hypothetical protein
MFKIVLIIILLSLINADKNFLGEKSKLQQGEEYLFWKGFINGTQVFHNLNNSKACLAILPTLHDDWVDIINLLNELETQDDFVKVYEAVVNKLEDMYSKSQTVEQPCSDMMKDTAHRLAKLSHYFTRQWVGKMFIHAYTNISDIKQRYQLFKAAYLSHDYSSAGYALGDLTRFIIIWDFQPKILNNLLIPN